MGNQELKEEKYVDIEDLLKESLADTKITEENEDLVLEYLCKTITANDSQGELKKKAENGDSHADIQLASWHIANAKNIKDYCIAYKHASKAAKQGYVEAYYILGQLYLYGVGCTKNTHKAIRHLRYFVSQITKKDLLNDEVLFDAYMKLAEAEKSLGHYSKAYLYYQELQKYDSHYDIYAKEMIQEMKKRRRELLFQTIFVACSFTVLCGMVYFLVRYFNEEAKLLLLNSHPLKDAVTVVEENGADIRPEPAFVAHKAVEEEIIFQEPMSYRIVSEIEFLELGLSEIAVIEATATSEYISTKGNNFSPANLIDHDSTTTWQEGEEDAGIGQQLNFVFDEPAIVSAIRLENGKRTSKEAFYENNRIASFRVFDDNSVLVEISDSEDVQYILFENPIMQEQVELTLESVFGGTKWNDTCIADIAFFE